MSTKKSLGLIFFFIQTITSKLKFCLTYSFLVVEKVESDSDLAHEVAKNGGGHAEAQAHHGADDVNGWLIADTLGRTPTLK